MPQSRKTSKGLGMAAEWPKVRVGDVSDSVSETHELSNDALIFLNTSDVLRGRILHHSYSRVQDWPGQAKKSIKRDDILFSEIRPANGRYAYVDVEASDYVVSTKLMVIRARDGVRSRFLYHFLTNKRTTDWLQHLAESRSGTFPQITFDQVAELELSLPPNGMQGRIVSFLDSLDDKIELNRRMTETLEAMARAIFKSWFVDFDPVRAKAEGRSSGLAKPLADIFPARLVASELGEIPEGWGVGTVGHLSSLNPETWSKKTRPSIIKYVDLSNTKWGRIEAVTTYAQRDAPSRAQRVLQTRDTIVGSVRPGNGSYAFVFEDGLTGSTGFAVLRPLRVEYAEFVYFAATAAGNIKALSHLADGGAYPAVRPEVVAATQVVKPGDAVIERFSNTTGLLLAKMAKNDRSSQTLVALRDALLPKLLSGEVRAPKS
jgi:type I restriction enzyme, S subunit